MPDIDIDITDVRRDEVLGYLTEKYGEDAADFQRIYENHQAGDYSPEMTLDLHGLTREMAKAELAALIHTARKELIDCVCVMHGFGQGVLKAALPHYLVQHPHVRAFHQAPLEYGGQAALLVLIDIPLQNNKR